MKKLIAWSVCLLLGGSLMAQDASATPDKHTPAASAPAGAPAFQLALELSDGSRVIGTPAIDQFKIKTQYAELTVPLSRMRSIEFSNPDHAAKVSLQNGDLLNGQMLVTKFAVKTSFGQVVIALDKVRKIRVEPVGEDLPDGLVLHYAFARDEGGRVTDSSGFGSDGKVHGAAYTKEGRKGGAMSFSGDGDAVIVGNPASLRLQNFTIMAWIKRGDADKVSKTTEYGEIFGYGSGGYVLGIDQQGYLYLSQADIHIGSTSSFQIHDKDFHHVAVTKQGNKFVFYLDGIAYPAEDYETEGDFVFNTDAAVGARSDDLHKCFLGEIGEVEVFKRPLSADEVKEIYKSQK